MTLSGPTSIKVFGGFSVDDRDEPWENIMIAYKPLLGRENKKPLLGRKNMTMKSTAMMIQ